MSRPTFRRKQKPAHPTLEVFDPVRLLQSPLSPTRSPTKPTTSKPRFSISGGVDPDAFRVEGSYFAVSDTSNGASPRKTTAPISATASSSTNQRKIISDIITTGSSDTRGYTTRGSRLSSSPMSARNNSVHKDLLTSSIGSMSSTAAALHTPHATKPRDKRPESLPKKPIAEGKKPDRSFTTNTSADKHNDNGAAVVDLCSPEDPHVPPESSFNGRRAAAVATPLKSKSSSLLDQKKMYEKLPPLEEEVQVSRDVPSSRSPVLIEATDSPCDSNVAKNIVTIPDSPGEQAKQVTSNSRDALAVEKPELEITCCHSPQSPALREERQDEKVTVADKCPSPVANPEDSTQERTQERKRPPTPISNPRKKKKPKNHAASKNALDLEYVVDGDSPDSENRQQARSEHTHKTHPHRRSVEKGPFDFDAEEEPECPVIPRRRSKSKHEKTQGSPEPPQIPARKSTKNDVVMVYPTSRSGAIAITLEDLKRLEPHEMVNDSIIEFYMQYIYNTLPPDRQQLCHFFNPFFFKKLSLTHQKHHGDSSAYKTLCSWTKTDLFEKQYIIVPIHEGAHWSLAIVCMPSSSFKESPCVIFLDSLLMGVSYTTLSVLGSFLQWEWQEKHGSQLDKDETSSVTVQWDHLAPFAPTVPRQTNYVDCGLYLLVFVETFVTQLPTCIDDLNNWEHTLTSEKFALMRKKIGDLVEELREKYAPPTQPSQQTQTLTQDSCLILEVKPARLDDDIPSSVVILDSKPGHESGSDTGCFITQEKGKDPHPSQQPQPTSTSTTSTSRTSSAYAYCDDIPDTAEILASIKPVTSTPHVDGDEADDEAEDDNDDVFNNPSLNPLPVSCECGDKPCLSFTSSSPPNTQPDENT
ncbi:Ulp1 protease family, catalytic domain protein [Pelomyxa schiedti]|nr:Ulp1 protease family, catalytic domain protein [Pelomyxa schiedti]